MATRDPTTPTPSHRSAFPTRTSSLNPAIPPSLAPSRSSASSILQNYIPANTTAAGASSSSLYLHHSEDPLIFEIGSRLLRAGFANEGTPRCVLEWTKEVFWSREGYIWAGEGDGKEGKGRGELWRGDLRNVEMGVVEDVVERGIRMAYNKYLLLDSKLKRVIVVIPTCFPTALLTSLTKSFFVHFQMPGIMLLESPIMSTMAAGTRSALVLDLGWEEAVVNVVYELRVVGRGGARGRSRRGGKVLRGTWQEFLEAELKKNGVKGRVGEREVEEILSRVGWCRAFGEVISTVNDTIIEIPLSTPNPPTKLRLPFSRFSEPAEKTFFAQSTTPSNSLDYPDDDDCPIPRLVYEALKDCPIDVRAACMQRIIVVGGASQVPGLKKRIVDEVRGIVESVGWERGQRRDKNKLEPSAPNPEPPKIVGVNPEINYEGKGEIEDEQYEWHAPHEEGQSQDRQVEEKKVPGVGGPKVRGLESLGAWVGASLVAGMKGKGNIEVDREKFLSTVAGGGSGFPFGF